MKHVFQNFILNFEHVGIKIAIVFLSINLNMRLGCSKEPSQ